LGNRKQVDIGDDDTAITLIVCPVGLSVLRLRVNEQETNE